MTNEGRRHPERPIVAVGAVIVDGDRVLLVKRGQEPLKGEWSLPGGVVEIGETLDAALVREVREETSLDIVVGPVIEVLESIRRDADGVCWAAVADLDRYRVTAAAAAVIRKAITGLQGF